MNSIDFSAIKRILIIKLRHHGDVLITTPVFSVLKELFPSIEIDALIYQDIEAMKAAITKVNPQITNFESSCFDGCYITGNIDAEYLDNVEASRKP